jgi:hypothetical protein
MVWIGSGEAKTQSAESEFPQIRRLLPANLVAELRLDYSRRDEEDQLLAGTAHLLVFEQIAEPRNAA